VPGGGEVVCASPGLSLLLQKGYSQGSLLSVIPVSRYNQEILKENIRKNHKTQAKNGTSTVWCFCVYNYEVML